jgi:predicted permease
MNRLGEWLRRVWYLLNRRRLDAALREEMAAHRAQMNRPGRFGNSLRLREEAHDVWGWRWLDDLGRDLRLGVRTLRRSPGFTLASLAILSVGIGINLAFFQVVDVALLQPLHVTAPQTLVLFHYRSPTFMSTGVPYPVARFVGARTDALSAVLVSRGAMGAWGDLGDEIVPGEFVSTNWFDELGASAAAGRVLHAGTDDGPAAPAVVVLSYRFWQRSFGGQFGIIGRTVRLNGQPAVVVGVADAQFRVLARDDPRFWIPIEQIDAFQPGSHIRTDWVTKNVTMYGRLRPGVSAAVAKTVLAAALDQLSAIRPDAIERGQWLEPYSAVDRFMPPQERRQAWTVVTGVAVLTAIVLMVTCLNLSNLTLVRAISRLREMSIRTALGAGRWRIVRHLGIESVLLATAGTLGGWVLGVGTTAVVASATEVSLPVGFGFDWRMALAVSCAALVATVAIGFAPAWKIGRHDLALAARDGGERASQGLHGPRLRQWIVAGQIAGSCVLLIFAGQMLRGLERALDNGRAFAVDRLAVLAPSPESFSSATARTSFWEDVRAIIGTQPDTDQMTLVTATPLGDSISTTQYPSVPQVKFQVTGVDPQFFSTMAIPILAGRAFVRGDTERTAVVISRRGALEVFGTANVVGRRFVPPTEEEVQAPSGSGTPVIVGIAADAHLSASQATDTVELYQPLLPSQAMAMIVRAKADPARLVVPLRDAARRVDGHVLPEVRLMRDDFDRTVRGPRLTSTIAGLMALLALVLTAVGIFGIVAYGVGLRAQEIGIRLALGASAGALLRMLLRYTLWSGAIGVLVGLAAGWPAGKAFAGAPYYLQGLDLAAYASVGAILFVTGIIAALVPAWRTLHHDPLGALRHE